MQWVPEGGDPQRPTWPHGRASSRVRSASLIAMEPVNLTHIPDNRRDVLEHWLKHCRDENPDEEEWMPFWDEKTTPEEIKVFVSPFDCADELFELLMQVRTTSADRVNETTLLDALRDYVAELADNALAVGEDKFAKLAHSVPQFRLVDEIESPRHLYPLEAEIREVIGDAVRDEAFAHPDGAVANFYCALGEWSMQTFLKAYLMQPLLHLNFNFGAFFGLWSLGSETLVTTEVALVCRVGPGPVTAPPHPPVIKGSAAKEAARAGVDWSFLPTAQQEIDELTAAADAGDHPALAKLSLMYMAGIGVEYDLPTAFDLLERAAGDYPSVLRCYEAGQKMNLAAADYGMFYLLDQGWGVPQSKERAIEYLQAAARGGFPHAMYLLGMYYRSGYPGVEEDLRQAEMWLTKAVATGYIKSYRMLYHLYSTEGELYDIDRAFTWLVKTANEGREADYQFDLGQAYETGEGTNKDAVQAFKWYYLAAQESEDMRSYIRPCFERLEALMSPSDIEKAKRQAVAWMQQNTGERGHFADV